MKEEFKNIILMGLGAMSLTTDKAKELKEELLKEGKKVYQEGSIANEELKHNIKEKIKDNVTVVVEKKPTSKEEIANTIKEMSEEEKAELLNLLKDTADKKNE